MKKWRVESDRVTSVSITRELRLAVLMMLVFLPVQAIKENLLA